MHLVIFDRDWGDEFSVYGMAILNDEYFAEFNKWVAGPDRSYCFGTNEEFYGDDITIQDFEIKTLTEEDERALTRLIPFQNWDGYPRFGNFPHFVGETGPESSSLSEELY